MAEVTERVMVIVFTGSRVLLTLINFADTVYLLTISDSDVIVLGRCCC